MPCGSFSTVSAARCGHTVVCPPALPVQKARETWYASLRASASAAWFSGGSPISEQSNSAKTVNAVAPRFTMPDVGASEGADGGTAPPAPTETPQVSA
jgi:hypothetical protein